MSKRASEMNIRDPKRLCVDELLSQKKNLQDQMVELRNELARINDKIEQIQTEQKEDYDWMWVNGEDKIYRSSPLHDKVLFYDVWSEFKVEFWCAAGPIGRLDEYDGKIDFEVRDCDEKSISESEITSLFEEDQFDLNNIVDIDHKTRIGSWYETKWIEVLKKTMFIPNDKLNDCEWMAKHGPQILYIYEDKQEPPKIYTKVESKLVNFKISQGSPILSGTFFADDDKLIEAILLHYRIDNDMEDGDASATINKYKRNSDETHES